MEGAAASTLLSDRTVLLEFVVAAGDDGEEEYEEVSGSFCVVVEGTGVLLKEGLVASSGFGEVVVVDASSAGLAVVEL